MAQQPPPDATSDPLTMTADHPSTGTWARTAALCLFATTLFAQANADDAAARGRTAQPQPASLQPLLGQVVGADGEPIEGAEVHCVLPDETAPGNRTAAHVVVKTDARGRFCTKVRPCTQHLIWAIGPQGDQRVCSKVQWTTSGLVSLRADRPRPDCTVNVRGLEAWQKFAPFRLRIAVAGSELADVELEIPADGTCELPPTPADQVQLDVIDKDGQPLYSQWFQRMKSLVTLQVQPPQQIPIRAIDDDGEPVAGAIIRYRMDGGITPRASYTAKLPARRLWRQLGETDADGTLRAQISAAQDPFLNMVRGTMMFVAEKDGRKTSHSGFADSPYLDGVIVPRVGCSELRFTMPKAEALVGRVRGLADQPLLVRRGIRIEGVRFRRLDTLLLRVRTDENGQFRVPQLQTRLDTIDILLRGDRPRARLMPAALQRRTPQRTAAFHGISDFQGQPLEFAVDQMPTLEIQLLDANGGPANDAELLFVSLERKSITCDSWTTRATADSAGRVAIRLEPGKWFVFGRNARHMAQLRIDLQGDERHELRLKPMPAMHGKLVDANGKPVANAQLYCYSTVTGRNPNKGLAAIATCYNWDWISDVYTDENGDFYCAFLEMPGNTYEARFISGKRRSAAFHVQASEEPLTFTMPND